MNDTYDDGISEIDARLKSIRSEIEGLPDKPVTHELKTWPEYFKAVCEGTKTFEIRKDDRDFRVGDYLYLREFDPVSQEYGQVCTYRIITYKLNGGAFGIEEGYCVLGMHPLTGQQLREIPEPTK